MRAVLRYTDCLNDEKHVFRGLACKNVEIIQTKRRGIHPEITVVVDDHTKLNDLLKDLNERCTYGLVL